MWRMVNAYRFRLNALCKAKARDDVTPSEERQLEKDIRYYSEQITFLYAKLLVHEKPKLASVEVKGDPQSPLYHEVVRIGP
jgi:hypothetical protein